MTNRTRNLLLLTLATTMAVGLILAVLRLRAEPLGRFAFYSMCAHDSCDALTFSNGNVIWQSCCGEESWGTYRRGKDGWWVWTMPRGTKNPTTNTFLLQPGVLHITCVDTQNPPTSYSLRRRLFTKIPL